MKKSLLFIAALILNSAFSILNCSAQTWTQKTNFGGTGRYGAVSFSIGTKGYIGTGNDNSGRTKDFWEWDQASNVWTQKANFGGTARYLATGFSIGTKGYIGTGSNGGSSYYNDFWEWDQATNVWTQKTNFSGAVRYMATGLSIGVKGYIGTGYDGTSYYQDFWEFDPANTSNGYDIHGNPMGAWTAKANFPGTSRLAAVGFSIGTNGYIGTGYDGVKKNDFYEYSQSTDTWTPKANFQGTARDYAVGFSIGTKGYIGTGNDGAFKQDFWEWNQLTNMWTRKANFPGTIRNMAVGFSIGTKGYIGTGSDNFGNNIQDFWEFGPSDLHSVQPCFSTAPPYSLGTGTTPRGICTADFNNDGKMDLATADNGSTNIAILMGNGAGVMTFSVNVGAGSSPRSVCSADFNHDGKMDLAVADNGAAVVSVLIGNGDGTFQVAVTFPTGSNPASVISADFDGDGNMDLATANNGSNNVTVLRGNGTGSFPTVNTYTTASGGSPSGITAADFNGDGKPDLAVANATTGNVSILLNIGTGTFGAVSNFGVGTNPGGIISADFNGDGKMDLAIDCENANQVYMLLGDGSGNFPISTPYAVADHNYGLCYGDFNGDGKLDLATANTSTTNNVSVLTGNGDGTFQSYVNFGLNGGTTPMAICSADFNGDGKLDMATANSGTNNVSVLLNSLITGSMSETNVICNGSNNGTAAITVATGSSPYTYNWQPNSYTTSAITGLAPINYSVTVTNTNGCNATATVAITQPTAISLTEAWTQKTNFGGTARKNAVGFSIGTKAYIGTGEDGTYKQDFWEWDQASNVWTQKANFGGTGRSGAVGFSIGTKGYIGTGEGVSGVTQDFYEYDPSNNTWTAKADFAGGQRWLATGFSIGTKGYIGTGFDNTNKKQDLWEYDPSNDTWTQKANFGGTARYWATGFSIGTKGYIGTGFDGTYKQDFWEWDQASNVWTQKANFGGTSRYAAVSFSIGTKGYVGIGFNSGTYYQDFWEWDQATNAWLQKINFAGTAREESVGFSIGNKGYIGTGYDGGNTQDFWEYFPGTTQTNVSCHGGNNGSATANISGGTSPYTYLWEHSSDGGNTWTNWQATPTATGLSAGSFDIYQIIVTDTKSCTATASVTITQPNALTVIPSSNTAICSGGNTTISSTVNGGSGNYNYSWSPTTGLVCATCNSTNASPTVSTTYTVTVTDANNCTAQGSVTVTVNSPTVTASATPNPICSGQTLSLTASTIVGATYSWSGPNIFSSISQNPTITNITTLGNGTYSVTATISGCTSPVATKSVTVNQTPSPIASALSNPICSGQTLSLTASTIAGATYSWSGPNTFASTLQNPIITNVTTLGNGTYSVMATLSGCTSPAGTTSVTVNQTPTPTASALSNPICSGQTLSLTASTIAGATYSWSGPNLFSSASQNPNIISATTAASGTYSVVATANGCTGPVETTSVITVNPVPSAPIASAIPNPVNVGNTLSLSASNISGATYNWSGPSFTAVVQNPTISIVTTATAGTYSVTATVNGCTSTAGTVSVSVSTLSITTSTQSVSCNGGNDGAASIVNVTGGTSPYTYSWSTSPVQTDVAIGGLSAGTYTLTVTDSHSVSATTTVNITQPSLPVSVNFVSQVNVSCFGGNNGSVHAIAGGGTSPYNYSWNTFPVQTTYTATNLTAGNYMVTVADGNGCIKTSTVSITQPNALVASVDTTTNADCGSSNGSVKANATGGTSPYSYVWNTTPVKTTQSISNLASGTYSFTVTDAKGCTSVSSATVGTKHANFNLAFSGTPQNGPSPLNVTFSNSTPSLSNYNFTWYYGDGSNANNNSATVFYTYNFAGTYNVALIATSIANGCTDTLVKAPYINVTGTGCTHTVSVTPSGPLNKCQGDTVILTAGTNAVAPFSYQWNIGSVAISGETNSTLAVTQSGYYSCTVIKGSCPVTSSAVQINFTTHPQSPTVTSDGTIAPCTVGSTETLTASSISGVTYSWNTTPVQTTTSIIVNSSNNYVVTVTNSAGCTTASAPFTVNTTQVQVPICMVTVDTTSSKNLILWDKPANAPIDSFRIYRQIASTYKHVGSVSYDSLSEFIDNTNGVNPNITSYKYEISILDSCGNESVLSSAHRTIHLSVSPASPCGYNLSWNDYIGIPISQYRILRDSAHTGWRAIDSVSYGNTAWTDITCYPAQDSISYILEIDNLSGCTASYKNTPQPMAISLNSSRSNTFRTGSSATNVINANGNMTALVYPNPSNGVFNVQMSGLADVQMKGIAVYNVLGELVYSFAHPHIGASSNLQIDLSKLAQGIYYLQISTTEQTLTKKIVIE